MQSTLGKEKAYTSFYFVKLGNVPKLGVKSM